MARSTPNQCTCLRVWSLVAALISHNMMFVLSSTFQDQKNFFLPPIPGIGTPPVDPGVGTPPVDPGVGTPPVDPGVGYPPVDPGGGSPPVITLTPPIVPSPPIGYYTSPPPTHGGGTPPVHRTPPPSHGDGGGGHGGHGGGGHGGHGGGGHHHHHGGNRSPPANCGNPTPRAPPRHVDPSPPHHNPSPASPTYHYSPPPAPPAYHYNPPPSGGGGGGGCGGCTPTPTVPSLSPPVVLPPITPGTPLLPSPPYDPNSPPIGGTCDYWRNHPGIIWGLFGWWGTTIGSAFGVTSLPGTGSSLNLLQALSNTRTDGIGALYREGTASLLNSMVNKNFPYSTSHVKDSFAAAVGSNKAAAAQARVFKLANEGHMKLRV